MVIFKYLFKYENHISNLELNVNDLYLPLLPKLIILFTIIYEKTTCIWGCYLILFELLCYSGNYFKQFIKYLGAFCLSLPQNNIDTIIYTSITKGVAREAFFHIIE